MSGIQPHEGHGPNEYTSMCVACRLGDRDAWEDDPALEAARELVFRSLWWPGQRAAIARACAVGASLRDLLRWIDASEDEVR